MSIDKGCLSTLKYSTRELFDIKKAIKTTPLNRIDDSLWEELCDLNIAKRRTSRAGRKVARKALSAQPRSISSHVSCNTRSLRFVEQKR